MKTSVALLVVLISASTAAEAFSFCFSAGGGGNNRADFYRRPPPAVGFGPGIYHVYPYSPVYAYPGRGTYYLPPPVMPDYGVLPADPEKAR